MNTYAAIDVGTNSVRLLVVELVGGRLKQRAKDLLTTRIGEGMGSSVYLKEEAIHRTAEAVREFYHTALKLGAKQPYVFATSAVRDAANKQDFVVAIQQRLGFTPEILSGEEEAKLSFLGATSALPQEVMSSAVVIDIGGGSTEIIFKEKILQGVSIPLGAVRLAENPLSQEKLNNMFAKVVEQVPFQKPFLLGVGGTVTSLAAIEQKLAIYDPSKVHGYKLTTEGIKAINSTLHALSLEERQNLPGLDPKRADIIPYGTEILTTLLELFHGDYLTVSESDILEGRILLGLEVSIG